MSEGLHEQDIDAIVSIAREAEERKQENEHAIREINGRTFAKTDGWKEIEEPEALPGIFDVSTLQGFVDYIKDKPDLPGIGTLRHEDGNERKAFVHIDNPTTVLFGLGAGGPYSRRAFLARAKAIVPSLGFGSRMGIEDFLVTLRTQFVETPGVLSLVDHFSHIDATNTVKLADDGIAQEITVNRGVRGKESVKIRNPMPLAPLRTFSEVGQPETPFLIRLESPAPGAMPLVTLREADLGQWRLQAIRNIKDWLRGELEGSGVAIYG